MTTRLLWPSRVEIGAGSLNLLPNLLADLAVSRPFVIVDAGLPPVVMSQLVRLAGGESSGRFARAPVGEPTTESADLHSSQARAWSSDGVIGVGGGSVMDLAKAVAMLVGLAGEAAEYQGVELVRGPGLPVICVPTTAGSGAEATRSAVLTNVEASVKRGINAVGVLPNAVILDPELLLTLPPQPRIAALLDATAHALEAFVGRSSWAASDMAAMAAFPLLGEHLRLSVESLDLEQGERALLGSFFAGVSICNSETGAVHALAYPLTEYHGVRHAYAVGSLIPWVMRLQKAQCARRLAEASSAMGFESEESFLDRVSELSGQLGLSKILGEIVEDDFALSRLMDRAMALTGALHNSPRPWTRNDAALVYRAVADRQAGHWQLA